MEDLVAIDMFLTFSEASAASKTLARDYRVLVSLRKAEAGWEVLVPRRVAEKVELREAEEPCITEDIGPYEAFLVEEELGMQDEPHAWQKWVEENQHNNLYDDVDGGLDPARPRFPIVNYTGFHDDDDDSEDL